MSMPDSTVSATAIHRTARHSQSMSAVTGHTNAPTDSIWKNAFHLPSRTAGSEIPLRPATTRHRHRCEHGHGVEVGADRAGDVGGHDRAGPPVGAGDAHDAVDLGGL